MSNENCLEGVKCPDCGNEARFFITATITAEVTDDGADMAKHSDIEWEDSSLTRCAECGKEAPLCVFRP